MSVKLSHLHAHTVLRRSLIKSLIKQNKLKHLYSWTMSVNKILIMLLANTMTEKYLIQISLKLN